jgi:cell fate regulator YaaT (PSP1 superfamily)
MPNVVGIKFKYSSKQYYFEAGDLKYTEGGNVLVETTQGLEMGKVVMLPTEIDEKKIIAPLRPVLRIATEKDEEQARRQEAKRAEALRIAGEKIAASGLDMKLVDAEYTFDNSKLILHFTAEVRVDFRDLVKDLAATFRTRKELKQIGSRDECKKKGGLGPCGRACCCSDHTKEFAHVTIKMANNQNLSLNPAKISGLCGRLMCCLAYENDYYAAMNKLMPKQGTEVLTVDGRRGIVTSFSQLKETVTLRINEKDIYSFVEFSLSDIIYKGKQVANEPDDEPTANDPSGLME